MTRKISQIKSVLILTIYTTVFLLQCQKCSADLSSKIHYSTTDHSDLSSLHTNTKHLRNQSMNVTSPPCPPWYVYSSSDSTLNGDCFSNRECLKPDKLPKELKCSNTEGAKLEYGYCVTYDDVNDVFQFGSCQYLHAAVAKGHHITQRGYVILPDNVSEVNHYMCHLTHRKGPLCSECEDGYGLSLSYTCSNCSGVWYGVPLYLAVELVPLTLLYFVILAFQINLTSAPVTCFTLYSQVIFFQIQYDRRLPIGSLVYQLRGIKLDALRIIYGTMNLENAIRFIAPPFCVNRKLKLVHMAVLEYLPAFYPLFLILFTWLCIELHGRNLRLVVWTWKPFHKCFVRLRRKWNTKSDLVDVFSSFFLLSYSKILFQSLILMDCIPRYSFTDGNWSLVSTTYYNPNLKCSSNEHIGLALIAATIFLTFNILPALLLVLYPFKIFRACLSRCRLNLIAIATFVDKFHGCYRDGLAGGRDMRSFSGLYFFLRIIIIAVRFMSPFILPNIWLCYAILYSSITLLIAYIKPYKRSYMNVLDVLLLANLSLLGIFVSAGYFETQAIEVYILMLIPIAVLGLFVGTKLLLCGKKLNLVNTVSKGVEKMMASCKCCGKNCGQRSQSTNYSVCESDDQPTAAAAVSSTTISLCDSEQEPLFEIV